MSSDFRKDFLIKFGNICKEESSGAFCYIRTHERDEFCFPDEYAFDEDKIIELMKKSLKDNHDYLYDLTKDVPKMEYKDGCYY